MRGLEKMEEDVFTKQHLLSETSPCHAHTNHTRTYTHACSISADIAQRLESVGTGRRGGEGDA